jgi:hypothetical protein
MRRLIVGVILVSSLIGCGGQKAEQHPRTVAEVQRAFAHHRIPLVRIEPSLGVRVRYTALFGQSGSLAVSVRVYSQVRPERSLPAHTLAARNVLVTWQGADSPSVEAAVDELR